MAGEGGCGSMMGPMGMPGVWWWMPGLMIVFLVVVVAATFGVARYVRRPISGAATALGSGESAALALAKERYARGELDDAEFERLLDHLLRADARAGRGSR